MEKLSPRCKLICAAAMACLVAAIVTAPAAPRIELATEGGAGHGMRAAGAPAFAREGVGGIARLPDCSGADSVNCHRPGNQAGL